MQHRGHGEVMGKALIRPKTRPLCNNYLKQRKTPSIHPILQCNNYLKQKKTPSIRPILPTFPSYRTLSFLFNPIPSHPHYPTSTPGETVKPIFRIRISSGNLVCCMRIMIAKKKKKKKNLVSQEGWCSVITLRVQYGQQIQYNTKGLVWHCRLCERPVSRDLYLCSPLNLNFSLPIEHPSHRT